MSHKHAAYIYMSINLTVKSHPWLKKKSGDQIAIKENSNPNSDIMSIPTTQQLVYKP